jgi:hypothetical protein
MADAKKGRKEEGSVSDKSGGKADPSKNVDFAEGGHSNHMFGEQSAGDQKPGGTSHTETSAPGDKFAAGGTTKMFGFQGAVPARSGITSAR